MKEIICDGINAFVFDTDGNTLILSGWNTVIRDTPKGTKLLISIDNGHTGHPYIVTKDNTTMYPKDQYFIECEFIHAERINNA